MVGVGSPIEERKRIAKSRTVPEYVSGYECPQCGSRAGLNLQTTIDVDLEGDGTLNVNYR